MQSNQSNIHISVLIALIVLYGVSLEDAVFIFKFHYLFLEIFSFDLIKKYSKNMLNAYYKKI